jgi:prepilin-type N-terminal cleavage/methylation domain-containing protein
MGSITFMAKLMRGRKSMRSQAGFSLLELTVAMGIMLVVVGSGMSAILQVVNSQQTIWNRTEMHSGVRSATELLQQEVGQAGRLPPLTAVTLTANAAVGTGPATVASTAGMFNGEQVIVDSGINQETVTISNVTGTQFTATFVNAHNNGVPVMAAGGFWGGVVPVAQANGSTGTVLKLFGDINSDGNMLYIEYTCDTVGGNLYRNTMAWNAGAKPAVTPSMVLLRNIVANPGNAACFTYQTQVVNGTSFVIDVAITLTVQTQQVDPLTQQFQKETKALLNVSPRNIFDVWELASAGLNNRVQPIPPTVLALLP